MIFGFFLQLLNICLLPVINVANILSQFAICLLALFVVVFCCADFFLCIKFIGLLLHYDFES